VSFAAPQYLFSLLLLPLAAWGMVVYEQRRTQRATAWTSPHLMPNMMESQPGRRRYVPAACFLIGLALLLTGFARPQMKLQSVKEGATVVLALDISGSMAASDVKPSRLFAADLAISQFADALPSSYRVALVTFSQLPAVRMPPTYDHAGLVTVLPTKTEPRGTALGDAIALALKVAKTAVGPGRPGAPHPPAAILLLSDGIQNAGKLKSDVAAKQARKAGVPISTVSLGTLSGVVEQPLAGGTFQRIQVPVDPSALKTIAATSGGTFFSAATAAELSKVYKDLGSKLVHTRKAHEITDRVTGAALVFMLGGVLASGVWFRRIV